MVRLSVVVGTAVLALSAALPAQAQRAQAPHAARVSPVPALAAPDVSPGPAPLDESSGFARSGFAQFMASPAGRVLRVVAGVGMVAGGVILREDGTTTGGTVLAAAGLVPLSAGALDLCWLSPLFGGPLRGDAIRSAGK
jgi:hypothetical protein